MRLGELLESNYLSKNVWYHGSGMNFDAFDTKAKRLNRSTNPEGIYLTKNEDLAREYAARGKKEQGSAWVYECEIDVFSPWIEDKTPISDEMVEEYISQLSQHTTYNEEWIRNHIAPDFRKNHRMKFDLPGELKTAVFQAGGHDAYIMNDMGDPVMIVFDADDIHILNKFQPQELKKDPKYDKHLPKSKEKPKAQPKQEPTGIQGIDDIMKDFE